MYVWKHNESALELTLRNHSVEKASFNYHIPS